LHDQTRGCIDQCAAVLAYSREYQVPYLQQDHHGRVQVQVYFFKRNENWGSSDFDSGLMGGSRLVVEIHGNLHFQFQF
jgi:hypothetical protein